jgi:hypothetical protein
MKFISRKTHSILDYVMGVVLIAAPWILGFANIEAAKWSAVGVGIAMLGMSLLTDYEGGVMKTIPMSAHLTMDVLAGIFLAVSPWLFGFSDQVYLPHLIFGILEVGAGLCTQPVSQHANANHMNIRHA